MEHLKLLTHQQRLLLIMVAVVLSLLSACISTLAYQFAQTELKTQFHAMAANRFRALEREIATNLGAIVAMKTYFLTSNQVTQQDFHTFTQPFLNSILSIQALEWIPRISHQERASYEAQVRKGGLSDYSIRERSPQGAIIPAQTREEYYPVHFSEPIQGKERALGLDFAFTSLGKQALEQTHDQGSLISTELVTLAQESEQQFSFLVLQPVFQRTLPQASEGIKNTALRGFVLGVYRIESLVTHAMEQFKKPWVQTKIDMPNDRGVKPLYGEDHTLLIDFSMLVFQRDLSIGKNIWRVQFWPTAEFIHAHQPTQWIWISLSIGTVAILLFLLVAVSLVYRAQIEQEVTLKTQQLSDSRGQLARSKEIVEQLDRRHKENYARLQAIVETASEGIITINEQGLIESANASAERIFQYQVEELKGRNVSMLMPSPYHEEHDGYLASYRNTGKAKIIGTIREVVGRRKNGDVFPMELSLSEVRWENQRMFTGFVRDISERKDAEAERDTLNKQLVDTSRRVGMAEAITGVLHNVGNVLNSINIAAGVLMDTVRRSSLDKVSRTAELIQENLHDVGSYLTQDPKGQQIPEYLGKLGHQLTQEQETVLREINGLVKNIEHIKEIINVQQSVARSSSMEEPVVLADLVNQALSMKQALLDTYQVQVVKDYHEMPEIVVDKHQVLQVLLNLISNAKQAMKEVSDRPRILTLRLLWFKEHENEWVKFEVQDTGVGISPDNMNRMFSQGFTTKKDGHGFGLHSGALNAKLMGGSLTVSSEGEGRGAMFTLTIPAKKREVAA